LPFSLKPVIKPSRTTPSFFRSSPLKPDMKSSFYSYPPIHWGKEYSRPLHSTLLSSNLISYTRTLFIKLKHQSTQINMFLCICVPYISWVWTLHNICISRLITLDTTNMYSFHGLIKNIN
jgi:hypothetical protein